VRSISVVGKNLTACGTSPSKGEVYGHAGCGVQRSLFSTPVPLLGKERLGEVDQREY